MEAVGTISTSLDPLHWLMMERIDSSKSADICKRILAIVSVMYWPIALEELPFLGKALGNFKPHDLADFVVSYCSLLTLRDRAIYFVHQSAKDHLCKKKETTTFFPSGDLEAHHDIFLWSLVALRKLRCDIYRLYHPGFLHWDRATESFMSWTPPRAMPNTILSPIALGKILD